MKQTETNKETETGVKGLWTNASLAQGGLPAGSVSDFQQDLYKICLILFKKKEKHRSNLSISQSSCLYSEDMVQHM